MREGMKRKKKVRWEIYLEHFVSSAQLHFVTEGVFLLSFMNNFIGGVGVFFCKPFNKIALHIELLKTCSHRTPAVYGPSGRGEAE